MAEPALDPTAALAQVRAAARAFAAGDDGSALLPPQLRAAAAHWQQRLQCAGEVLDSEAWLLGLLTLTCLAQRASLLGSGDVGSGCLGSNSSELTRSTGPD